MGTGLQTYYITLRGKEKARPVRIRTGEQSTRNGALLREACRVYCLYYTTFEGEKKPRRMCARRELFEISDKFTDELFPFWNRNILPTPAK